MIFFSFWPDNLNNFDNFFLALNNLVPSINFKVEWENNKQLPFLDVLVVNNNGKPDFTVYRKPTHCNLYMHYFSYHDDNVKYSVISSMFLRALRLCSPQFLESENVKIWNIFRELKYPDWFIQKAYFKARKTFYVPPSPDSRKKQYLCLPYINGLENIKPFAKNLNVELAFKYSSTVKNMLVKNNFTKQENVGVYSIPCKDCSLVYIGETGRNVETRLKEHKYAFKNYNTDNAIFCHAFQNNHCIDWESTRLLYKCNNYVKRKVIESVCIEQTRNFNLSEGTYKLDPLMRFIVHKSLPDPGNPTPLTGQVSTGQPPTDNPTSCNCHSLPL